MKKISRAQLRKLILAEIAEYKNKGNDSLQIKETSYDYKGSHPDEQHQRNREPGRRNLASVDLPTPSTKIDVPISNDFYKNMIELYEKVGMHAEANQLRIKIGEKPTE